MKQIVCFSNNFGFSDMLVKKILIVMFLPYPVYECGQISLHCIHSKVLAMVGFKLFSNVGNHLQHIY